MVGARPKWLLYCSGACRAVCSAAALALALATTAAACAAMDARDVDLDGLSGNGSAGRARADP
jgi:hypothetical protein